MDLSMFKNPPVDFRSAPFWSWNDDLDVNELKRQLKLMKEAGQAGGFMHSREGLITPYMSEKWMECIRECVKYARELEIPVYLYDEDRWPSGFSGGNTEKKNYMRILKVNIKGSKISYKVEYFPSSPWYNNTGYVDVLNRNAIKHFIETTHEKYKKEIKEYFGKTVPAIFTDEPQYIGCHVRQWQRKNVNYLTWTQDFENIFLEKYGYDIRKHIISLIRDTGDWPRIRYDYYRLLTELFVENYGKQIYEWCSQNNIAFTGHYDEEDSIEQQVRATGSVMPFYEYMHIPGIDHLGRQTEGCYLTILQCTSASRQLGKKRVLSEIFGGSGSNLSFEERKWIGNYNTVLGINFYCPHLWHYSLAGSRKRDWPQTLSYQQPYWKYNKIIEDYFARINYITSFGKNINQIAVLHPVETGWCLFTPKYHRRMKKINDDLIKVMKSLSDNNRNFDLCDESLLEKYGNVKNGKLVIGDASYRVFIIPPVITLRESTVKILEKFISEGGIVIGFKQVPKFNCGKKSLINKDFYSKIEVVTSPLEILNVINRNLDRDIEFKGKNTRDIYYQHRRNESDDIFFIINKSIKQACEIDVEIPAYKDEKILHLDAENGVIEEIGTKYIDNRHKFKLYFPEAGSHLILKTKDTHRYPEYKQIIPGKMKNISEINTDKFKCKKIDLNVLLIDNFIYKNRKYYFMDLQDKFEKTFKNGNEFTIKAEFNTELDKPCNEIYLVVERAGLYEIKINGKTLNHIKDKYYIDINFNMLDIKNCINLRGKNIIEIKGKFKNPKKPDTLIFVKDGVEIEPIYIVGDFCLKGIFKNQKDGITGDNFIITDYKGPSIKDMVKTGYPFFAGSAVFESDFNVKVKENIRYYIEIGVFNTITAKISVNEKEAGLISCHPYILDITEYLKDGNNTVSIELTNSLRNLMGPHHCKEINPGFVPPWLFNDKKQWRSNYSFVDFGIDKIKIVKIS